MRRRKLCHFIAALFSMLTVFPLVFMLMDRQLPMELVAGKVEPQEVHTGMAVTITWTAIKYRQFGDDLFSCNGTLVSHMTDAAGFTRETRSAPIMSWRIFGDANNHGNFSKEMFIPWLVPGLASYEVIFTYWCNPVQKYFFPIIHHEQIVIFMVREPAAGPKGDTGKTGERGERGETGEAGERGERGAAGQDRR